MRQRASVPEPESGQKRASRQPDDASLMTLAGRLLRRTRAANDGGGRGVVDGAWHGCLDLCNSQPICRGGRTENLPDMGPGGERCYATYTMHSEPEMKRIDAFRSDLAEGLRAILDAAGCRPLPASADPSDVCLAFGNYCARRIESRPRLVHRSDALDARTDLSAEEITAIRDIERKLRDGVDVYPHQSTTLLRPLTKDGLLTAWDIQHLHLGLPSGNPATPPFVNRSRNVALARVTDTDAYLIDCLPHGEGDDVPWWKRHLVEIIHRNWPDSIAAFRLDGYGPKFTDEDHEKLRSMRRGASNLTVAVSVQDGTSYLLTLGMVAAGYGLTVCRFADTLQNTVVRLAVDRRDDERLVVTGSYRNIEISVAPRRA